jgi:hypothetical protein
MSRKNGQAADTLQRSTPDDTALNLAVLERFLQLCRLWLHNYKEKLPVPAELDRDMLLWRTMALRHKAGDLRHKASEMKALRNVAAWTLEVKARMCGQPVPKVQGINC